MYLYSPHDVPENIPEAAEDIDSVDVKPMSEDILTIPSQDAKWLGKEISEMISKDTFVDSQGVVRGKLNYVKGFTAFNGTNVTEQEGYYFPVKLTTTGSTMTIMKNNIAREDKTNITFDPELLLRVSKGDKYDVFVDDSDEAYITLYFDRAESIFLPKVVG